MFFLLLLKSFQVLEDYLWKNTHFFPLFELSIKGFFFFFSFSLNLVVSSCKRMQTFPCYIPYHVNQGFISHKSLDPPQSCSARTLLAVVVPSTPAIRPFNKPCLLLELLLTCGKSMRQEQSVGFKHWDSLSSSVMWKGFAHPFRAPGGPKARVSSTKVNVHSPSLTGQLCAENECKKN